MKSVFLTLALIWGMNTSALPNLSQSEIQTHCVAAAKSYAEKSQAPWSEDARFVRVLYDSCYVNVSDVTVYGDRCYYNYVVDMKNWEVTMTELLSPACQPY